MSFAADPPPNNHGTLTHLFRTPEDFVYPIPENFSLEEAVLVEPLSVVIHGARVADITPGHTVLVQASGTIGLLCAATATAFGAKQVIISDINQTKLDFARDYLGCPIFLPNISSSHPEEEASRMKEYIESQRRCRYSSVVYGSGIFVANRTLCIRPGRSRSSKLDSVQPSPI